MPRILSSKLLTDHFFLNGTLPKVPRPEVYLLQYSFGLLTLLSLYIGHRRSKSDRLRLQPRVRICVVGTKHGHLN